MPWIGTLDNLSTPSPVAETREGVCVSGAGRRHAPAARR
jgi:hypothetical protein